MPGKAITVFPNVIAISKKNLLEFIHQYLNPYIEEIEDLYTGAEFCIGMKVLFPATISLQAVRFGPDLSNISIHNNFKQLQSAFVQVQVEKEFPMEAIMKGNFQANYYFAQWFMGFFFANYSGQVYNPLELRNYKENRPHNFFSGGFTHRNGAQQISVDSTGKYNRREKLPDSDPPNVSSQTDRSFLRDKDRIAELECDIVALKSENSDMQELIKYLENENKKIATAKDCTNNSTSVFFAKLEKIEELCDKEGHNSLRSAIESTLYSNVDQ